MQIRAAGIVRWCNGNIPEFESGVTGSNPVLISMINGLYRIVVIMSVCATEEQGSNPVVPRMTMPAYSLTDKNTALRTQR